MLPVSDNQKIKILPRTCEAFFKDGLIEENRRVAWKSREKLISMKIDDYLAMAKHTVGGIDKIGRVSAMIASGEKFPAIPFLQMQCNGLSAKVCGHEGRHRAMALKSLGYEYMPVLLKTEIRWSEQSDPDKFDYCELWPEVLIGEDGNILKFPVGREAAETNYVGMQESPDSIQATPTLSHDRMQRAPLAPPMSRLAAQLSNLAVCARNVLTVAEDSNWSDSAKRDLILELNQVRRQVPLLPSFGPNRMSGEDLALKLEWTPEVLLEIAKEYSTEIAGPESFVFKQNDMAHLSEAVDVQLRVELGLQNISDQKQLIFAVDRLLGSRHDIQYGDALRDLARTLTPSKDQVTRYVDVPPMPLDYKIGNMCDAYAIDVGSRGQLTYDLDGLGSLICGLRGLALNNFAKAIVQEENLEHYEALRQRIRNAT